ncbi:MAG: SAM-dependent methyltransferase [Chitinophagaceae bacterium]|nr:SAM-dependent methyltransferase [Chitinophagaceae bacterium]
MEKNQSTEIMPGAPQETSKVFLIPSELSEGIQDCIPEYVLNAVKECTVFFVENERTARRYLKRLWKEMVIDDYEWRVLKKGEERASVADFERDLNDGHTVGIISEAGCPGVADPGQVLIAKAQAMGVKVCPLVGPSSVLLALMASGMSGQSFRFAGYLPIDAGERRKAIKAMEEEILKTGTTQIFIETPYRNRQLMQALLETCRNETCLCVAVNITSPNEEYIRTLPVKKWKSSGMPDINKKPAIFLLGAGF